MNEALYNHQRAKMIAATVDGATSIHAAVQLSGYPTLCGLDPDDPTIGHMNAALPPGSKINCAQCRQVFDAATRFKRSDFANA